MRCVDQVDEHSLSGLVRRSGIGLVGATILLWSAIGCLPTAPRARRPVRRRRTGPAPERRVASTVSQVVGLGTVPEFQQYIMQSRAPALVEFYLPQCALCREMAPMVERLAATYKGRVLVAKMDLDHAAGLADQYRITTTPTFLIFSKGLVLSRFVGRRRESDFHTAIEAAMRP